MSIQINQQKCVGCGQCMEVCPGTLIEKEQGKAVMRYPRDCWGCASCVKECPVGAIGFFLGADIGGNGSVMTVTKDGQILHWNIHKSDGREVTIDVDRRSSGSEEKSYRSNRAFFHAGSASPAVLRIAHHCFSLLLFDQRSRADLHALTAADTFLPVNLYAHRTPPLQYLSV